MLVGEKAYTQVPMYKEPDRALETSASSIPFGHTSITL